MTLSEDTEAAANRIRVEVATRTDRAAEEEQQRLALLGETPADPRAEAAAAREDAGELWDSAERRDRHAAELEGRAGADAAEAWKRADTDNARRPREAVRRAAGTASKARRSRDGEAIARCSAAAGADRSRCFLGPS